MSDSLQPYGLYPIRLFSLWDYPGKNTGVDCHASSRGSSWPKDWIRVSYLLHWQAGYLSLAPLGKLSLSLGFLLNIDHAMVPKIDLQSLLSNPLRKCMCTCGESLSHLSASTYWVGQKNSFGFFQTSYGKPRIFFSSQPRTNISSSLLENTLCFSFGWWLSSETWPWESFPGG